jgi:hypothetical protein
MDAVIDFVLVAGISAFSVGLGRAVVFGLIFIVTLLVAPAIVAIIIASPVGVVNRLREKKQSTKEVAAGWAGAAKRGKALGQVAASIVYLAMLLVSWHLGGGYFWAAVVGVAFKLFIDFLWGDLPFQRPKNYTV